MVKLEVTAHIDAQCEPHVEIRNLGSDDPWASVQLCDLTLLCEVGTAKVFQQIADKLRAIDIAKAPGIEKTDQAEVVQA